MPKIIDETQIDMILEGTDTPINKAVFLSNLMTDCATHQSLREIALRAGKQAVRIIDEHRLNFAPGNEGDKAAEIRGYVCGTICRLEGKRAQAFFYPIRLVLPIFAAYLAGADVGAWLGTVYKRPNLIIYLGPVLGLIFLFFSPLFNRLGWIGSAVVIVCSIIGYSRFVSQLDFGTSGFAWILLSVGPMVLVVRSLLVGQGKRVY